MTNQSGIVLLDKSAGISSAKAIAQVKYKLQLDKIGHAGTLDPFATGLLVCLTGRATKLADFAEKGDKRYSGVIQFGISTDTDDITGNIISRSDIQPEESLVQNTIKQKFIGLLEQYPPKVSAIKINGKRAYKLAREGKDFVVPSRKVTVSRFEAEFISPDKLKFDICCSVGTYIRSIARDLGESVGTLACLSVLRREGSQPFSINDAVDIDNLSNDNLYSWERLFPQACRIDLEPAISARLQNGQQQVLSAIYSEFSSQIKDFRQVIYYSKSSDKPLGLLMNNGTSLELGFTEIL